MSEGQVPGGHTWWGPCARSAVAALAACGAVVLLATGPAAPTTTGLVVPLTLVAAGLAVLACAVVARRSHGRTAAAWGCLGGAGAGWGVAVGLWGLAPPGGAAAQVAEVLVLAAVAPAFLGLVLMPVSGWAPGARRRAGLDVLVLVLCLLVITTGLPTPASGGWSLAIPVANLVLMNVAVVLCRRHGGRGRPDLTLLVLVFGAWSLGHTLLLTVGSEALDDGRSPVTGLYAAGFVLLAAAAWSSRHVTHAAPGPLPRAYARLLSVLAETVVVAAAVTAVVVEHTAPSDWVVAGLAAAAVLVRQVVVASDARLSQSCLEAKVAERTWALRRLSERHARILDAVGEGIVSIDHEGRVDFANASAQRLLGGGDLLGRPACELLCAAPHEECPLRLVQTIGQSLRHHQVTLRTRSGGLLPVVMTACPTEDADGGGPPGTVVAFRDVTQQHAVEQMKSQFVTSVSHELRTPLTSIRGALEMLADGDAGALPAPATDLVATAERGAHRLGRLVEDIIDVERLASGDFSVVPRPTDVPGMLHGTAESLRPLADQGGVRLAVAATPATALCDPHRMEQALANLVGNAVKFSEVGGVVEIGATTVAGEQGGAPTEVHLWVRDEGRGIPTSEQPQIFDRFHQVSTSTAAEKGGTGLGLTITRAIVERHGGRIWVESEPGAGATFRFTLPIPLTGTPDPVPDPTPTHHLAH